MELFHSFINRIRVNLVKKGFNKRQLRRAIERIKERYENCPCFEDLPVRDPDFDDDYEFCDSISECPVPAIGPESDNSLPFLFLKQTHGQIVETRICELRRYYEHVQSERGEEWFPPEDEKPNRKVEPYNVPGEFGRTPLIQAVIDGNLGQVQKLIVMGANPYITDNNCDDALEAAIKNERFDIADFLRDIMN